MTRITNIDYSAIDSVIDLLSILRREKVPNNLYWKFLASYQERKAREKGIPLYGQFELTPLCNLDCKMCYVHLNTDQLNDHKVLSVDQWKSIMTQAHAEGMMDATLTGGECLIYSGFDELYLYLRSMGIQASIKTNGVLLNKERLDFFKRYPPKGITISLYGSNNDAYYKVTGHAVFDIVYNNLVKLKDVDYPVKIAVTPSRYMYDDIEHILELVNNLGFPYLMNMALIQPRPETGREICDISLDEYIEIRKMVKKADFEPVEPTEETDIKPQKDHEVLDVGIKCGAGRSLFNIDWKGQMTGCENLDMMKINLIDQSFSAAWKTINQAALTYCLPMECNNCSYEKVCFNCAAFRSDRNNQGHCNQQMCERTKRMVREGFLRL